jgi:hypothetical protein
MTGAGVPAGRKGNGDVRYIDCQGGRPPRVLNYLGPAFWDAYPDTPAAEFTRVLKLAQEGQPFMGSMRTVGGGEDIAPEYPVALIVQQRLDFERSVRYCQEVSAIGERRASSHG